MVVLFESHLLKLSIFSRICAPSQGIIISLPQFAQLACICDVAEHTFQGYTIFTKEATWKFRVELTDNLHV